MTVQLPPFPVDDTTQPAWVVDYLNEDGAIDPQMPLCAAGNALLSYHVRRDEFGPEGPDGATADAIRQEAEVAATAAMHVERERLARLGRLLPEGGRERVEWGSRGASDPIVHRTEMSAREVGVGSWGHTLLRRMIRSWPDGSSYTGPWVEVEPETKEEAA